MIPFQADYSADSHAKDHEAYMKISRSKRKRARAVADFERKDDDELGKKSMFNQTIRLNIHNIVKFNFNYSG